MSIKISIGVAEGEKDWELLEQCRNTPRTSMERGRADSELDTCPAGWPQPCNRTDDESEARSTWAW